MIEKFCNTTHPEPLTSATNDLTLHFHSDEDGTDSGFQIHYSVVEGIQGCGGTFTAKNGEFGSPIQDGGYPKNVECHYLIKMPRKNETRVKLSFTTFKLEDSTSCSFDFVEVSFKNPNIFEYKINAVNSFNRFMMEIMLMLRKWVDGVARDYHPNIFPPQTKFWLFFVPIFPSAMMVSA